MVLSSMTSLYFFLFAFLLPSSATQCIGKASYTVTFNAVWSAASHPKDYPTGRAHWSSFVGGSHNGSYTMWFPGGDSTTGVKNIAERGTTTALKNEMTNAGSSTLDIVTWSGISSGTGTRSGTINFDDSHTLLSIITMIAPSPDWFVGVHDYDLCNGSKWIRSAEVDLFPYDSGTDSGLKFISTNSVTSPPEKIHLLTGTVPNNALSSFFGYDPVPRMAFFTFQLKTLTTPVPPTDKMTTAAKATPTQPKTTPTQQATPAKPQVAASPASSQCIGKASYNVTFNSVWTAVSHPTDYPAGRAHWSRFVGGSHNGSYKMWFPGGDATNGVKNVAERGDPTALSNEMTNAGSSTLDIVIWTGIGVGSRTRSGTIDFDGSHTLLSLITMIAPSPDWFVGVRDYDLCNGSKWIQSAEVDLFPYDSGTDSGLKFISTNSVTSPPEKIHRLTGTVPNNTMSSFFGYNPVPRMAYFTFQLNTLTTPVPPTDKAMPTQQATPAKPQVTASPLRCKASGTAKYRIVFKSTWSAATHPGLFPSSNPHWSSMVGASHNSKYVMWATGIKASTGVKDVAERGRTGTLLSELTNAGANVEDTGTGGGIGASGTITVDLDVDAGHSLLSAITMIAPSPDWFSGIHDIDVCSSDGKSWINSPIVRDALLYDSGTDSGEDFTSPNQATSPPENMFRITGSTPGVFSGKTFPPFGTITITRLDAPATARPSLAPGQCGASGSPSYTVTFRATWTPETHPGLYPSGAHWSGVVACSHNSQYVMWKSGIKATEGVKDVAEQGKAGSLQGELDVEIEQKKVLSYATSSSISGTGSGNRVVVLTVDKDHPLVSAITMIAPSPDWFVGIHDISVCDGYKWVNRTFPLYPYDAGTDSGLVFSSPDNPTEPRENILLITGDTPGSFQGKIIPSFGEMTVTTGGAKSSAVAGASIVFLMLVIWRLF